MSMLLIPRIYIKEAFALLFLGKFLSVLELEVKMKAGGGGMEFEKRVDIQHLFFRKGNSREIIHVIRHFRDTFLP